MQTAKLGVTMAKSNSRPPPKAGASPPGHSSPSRKGAGTKTGLPKLNDDDGEPSKTVKLTLPDDLRVTMRPKKRITLTEIPEAPPTQKLMELPSLVDTDDSEETSTTQTRIRIHAPGPTKRAMLTVLTGLSAGQVVTLDHGETVFGRTSTCTVLLKDQGISREHCRIVARRGRRLRVQDLGSTNGTYVDGKRISNAKLEGGERIQLGSDVVMRFSVGDETEAQVAHKLYETSTRDRLTGCYSRGFFDERLGAEIAYSRRHGSPVGVILFDIDHFKRVNDDGGHAAGDLVLREVAVSVQQLVRAEDILARYGGEEFVMIVRGIRHENILRLAERVREAVERGQPRFNDRIYEVTISLGVASWEECGKVGGPQTLLQLADERLYRAKREGRNRTCGA